MKFSPAKFELYFKKKTVEEGMPETQKDLMLKFIFEYVKLPLPLIKSINAREIGNTRFINKFKSDPKFWEKKYASFFPQLYAVLKLRGQLLLDKARH